MAVLSLGIPSSIFFLWQWNLGATNHAAPQLQQPYNFGCNVSSARTSVKHVVSQLHQNPQCIRLVIVHIEVTLRVYYFLGRVAAG